MADVNCILQFEMVGDGLQVVGIVIHIVAVAGLSRATMSAPISCNDAETFADEKKHLRVPVVGRQRPAVTEDDGLSFAPVFIIDVDVSSVFFPYGYVWHCSFSFLVEGLLFALSMLSFRVANDLLIAHLKRYDIERHLNLAITRPRDFAVPLTRDARCGLRDYKFLSV